jgi:hypothetical protein
MALFKWVKPEQRKTPKAVPDAVGDRFVRSQSFVIWKKRCRAALAMSTKANSSKHGIRKGRYQTLQLPTLAKPEVFLGTLLSHGASLCLRSIRPFHP